jgi:hypothetical protein
MAKMDLYHIYHFLKKSWIIDCLLFIFICLCALMIYKSISPKTPFDNQGFYVNLSTGLLSVWLSVRIIDRLLKKRDRLQNARRTLLGNLSHPYEYSSRNFPHFNQTDLEYLKNEQEWFDLRWQKRRRFLKSKELNQADEIERLNLQLIQSIENYLIIRKTEYKYLDEKDREEKDRVDKIKNDLNELKEAIKVMIFIFWETDNPDKI